jgi:hypothetical protein
MSILRKVSNMSLFLWIDVDLLIGGGMGLKPNLYAGYSSVG